MKYRQLGKTGITVSEVGFGAWQLGDRIWGGLQDQDAIALVHKALDEGCNFFDTAPPYGEGRSEIILGKALAGKRDQVVLVTKFGHNPTGPSDFSAGKIRSSVERSLKAMQTDYIDGVLLHNPEQHILEGKEEHYEVLAQLKEEGKIRSYGASIDTSADLNRVMDQPGADIAEIYFHAIHQEVASAFPRAAERGMGLIVKVPLDSGWLSGKYNAQSTFTTGYRDRWTQEVKDRRSALVEQLRFLETDQQTMAQGALRFLLDYPGISTLIPGAKNETHLLNNLGASDGRLAQSEVAAIKALWDEQIKSNPLPW